MKLTPKPRAEPILHAAISAGGLIWISRTLLAVFVVYPLLIAIRASGMVSGPEGDSVLFRPGSVTLLELFRVALPLLASAFKTALLLCLLAMLLELLALALTLELLWTRELPMRERLARALRLLPQFLSVGAIVLLAQAALLLGSSLLGAGLKPALTGERLSSLTPVAFFGAGLCACGGLGAVRDVARAQLVTKQTFARDALFAALRCLRERPVALLSGAYASVAGAAFGYLCAARAVIGLELSSASSLPIALAFATHQAALLFAIIWRVRWLSRALHLASAHQTRERQTGAESSLR